MSVSCRKTLPEVRRLWEALPNVREWSGEPSKCLGVAGRPSQMSLSGWRPFWMSRSGWESLPDVW